MSNTHRNLPFLLLKAREELMTYFRPVLNEYNVTEQQWRIIRSLVEHGDLEPRQLCEHCIILSPSMAGILKRMEEVDLVQKIPKEDQRRINVRLTDKARALHANILRESNIQYQLIEDKIGKKEMKALYKALDDLLDTLQDDK
ncbi:homoprotocatechuate degradation operon regulator HpaR [Psychrobacter sp. I-STPA10]|uniref:homoprotocatechuate degradation operon regulator HpaR n=1 Tax=Psychrobacter sp. I-STPA10 TaxID=2585769 RepID=UPI0022A88750|nr:homoprotocatechuate degradation operon regulator HpaR [Psychrobacter sp. I-STPA10]